MARNGRAFMYCLPYYLSKDCRLIFVAQILDCEYLCRSAVDYYRSFGFQIRWRTLLYLEVLIKISIESSCDVCICSTSLCTRRWCNWAVSWFLFRRKLLWSFIIHHTSWKHDIRDGIMVNSDEIKVSWRKRRGRREKADKNRRAKEGMKTRSSSGVRLEVKQ